MPASGPDNAIFLGARVATACANFLLDDFGRGLAVCVLHRGDPTDSRSQQKGLFAGRAKRRSKFTIY